MGKKGSIDLRMPAGGIVRRFAYQWQPPFTCADAQNVRPFDVFEKRGRVGSRPGTAKAYAQQLGSGDEIRMLITVDYSDVDGTIKSRTLASAGGLLYRDESGSMVQVSSSLTLSSDRTIQAAVHNMKVFIADWDGVKATATNGSTTGTTFDSATYADWTAIGINANDYVVVITEPGSGAAVVGTYKIASIASGSITLQSAPGNATGISFRVERAPKVYDPITNTLAIWTATAGTVQNGCTIIKRWRDRIVLAGSIESPNVWFMSRQGNAYDWDVTGTGVDTAVAASNAEAGAMGEPITCVIPHSDECILFGCENSTWILRGDPAQGGHLDNLSQVIGILDKNSWCYSPEGVLTLLTRDGIYQMPPGCGAPLRSVSRDTLPQEFLSLSRSTYEVHLAFDTVNRGVHVFLTLLANTATTHWWLDWDSQGWWKDVVPSAQDPFVTTFDLRKGTSANAPVLLGCRDGYIRQFRQGTNTDDGTTISSYVDVGPIKLGESDYNDGIIRELIGVMSTSSGNVTWAVRTGKSAEAAYAATAFASGAWNIAGLNYKSRPMVRGFAVFIRLASSEANTAWSVERLTAVRESLGAQRLG